MVRGTHEERALRVADDGALRQGEKLLCVGVGVDGDDGAVAASMVRSNGNADEPCQLADAQLGVPVVEPVLQCGQLPDEELRGVRRRCGLRWEFRN